MWMDYNPQIMLWINCPIGGYYEDGEILFFIRQNGLN